MKLTATAVMLLLTTTVAASAHEYRGYGISDVDSRRANQMRRIEDDRRSGQLLTDGSPQEAIVVKHADFGYVSGIVTDDDRPPMYAAKVVSR